MKESAVRNSPLPPSVEKAYHQKCIELKRRIRGVEEANDVARQRVQRLDRAIMKMRVNRAFLMDRLAKLQELNESESERSSTRPSSPREHLPRTRSRGTPPDARPSMPSPPPASDGYRPPQLQHHHSLQTHPAPNTQQSSHNPNDGRSPRPLDSGYNSMANSHLTLYTPTDPPLIYRLPNGTSVMLIAPNTPKQAPWTLNDLDPRHHVRVDFESLSLNEQEDFIWSREYLPFDRAGNPVLVEYDPHLQKFVHIFREDRKWCSPIFDNTRKDSIDYRRKIPRPPPGPEQTDLYQRMDERSDSNFRLHWKPLPVHLL